MNPIFHHELWEARHADEMRAAARASFRPRPRRRPSRLRRLLGLQLVRLGALLVGRPLRA